MESPGITITVGTAPRSVSFEGSLLAEASSWAEGKRRWTVLRLYVADAGGYVVESVGESIVEGEVPYCSARSCTILNLLQALVRTKDGPPRLTAVARELLEKAAVMDDRIRSLISG